MRVILLSGGSGKRLWPLSNDARPKQFLRVLIDEQGEKESMVQRIWRQMGEANLTDKAYFTTGSGQAELLQGQLDGDVHLIVEPERRDTFPAIALSLVYLYSVEGVSLDETIVVMPVDPYVDTPFFSKLIDLESILDSSSADLVLMGVRPTYPSEQYGYIVPEATVGLEDEPYVHVNSFKEKPNEHQASELIKQGALWNCGVFAFKLITIIDYLNEESWPIQYGDLLKQYHKLPKTSFDYEIVEKMQRIVALPFEGLWKDLGTWDALTDEVSTTLNGKGTMSTDSLNTHIFNELDIPVAVLGCSDLIVASSPDGVLVANKSQSAKIKEVMSHFAQRPMYEERKWGWLKTIDISKTDDLEIVINHATVRAGYSPSYHYHKKHSEVWTMISGEGEFILNGQRRIVRTGDTMEIPIGASHTINAITDIEFIEVQKGIHAIEDVYMTYTAEAVIKK
jgi:mannose-1-phosphate guanylyltransferase